MNSKKLTARQPPSDSQVSVALASGSVLSDVWPEIRKGGAFRADAAKWYGPTREGEGPTLMHIQTLLRTDLFPLLGISVR